MYLAVPSEIYQSFFVLELIKIVVQEQHIKLVIYNPELESIEQ